MEIDVSILNLMRPFRFIVEQNPQDEMVWDICPA